jgi:hypothetical protein
MPRNIIAARMSFVFMVFITLMASVKQSPVAEIHHLSLVYNTTAHASYRQVRYNIGYDKENQREICRHV